MTKNGWRQGLEAVMFIAGGAALALAQSPTESLGSEGVGFLQKWGLTMGLVVVVGVLVAVGIAVMNSQRRPTGMENIYLEPAVVGSRFEQLLAEIQGLTLRVQGGESKGYYRKIEQLCRVFLERTGHKDARHLSDEEIRALMASGEISQDIAAPLKTIFERCKQGAIHESQKLDFSATELLRDLRTIIKQVERTSPTRA